MVDDFDLFEPIVATISRRQVRVAVVLVDHVARAACEPILRQRDCMVAIELTNLSQVRSFLGSGNTDSLTSCLTTRQLAVAAYRRARGIPEAGQAYHLGLAISQTNRGSGHVVIHSRHATQQCTFQLPDNPHQASPVRFLRRLILTVLARQLGLSPADPNEQAEQQHSVGWLHEQAQPDWQALVEGERLISGDCPARPILFPGSFQPIHEGHRQILALASSRLNRNIHLEISVTNADKPELDFLTIGHRVRQAESIGPVLLTQAPKFVDKAKLFPGATFLIGADTAMRLDDVRFYDNNAMQRDSAIQTIADHDCRFLVFGRLVQQTFHEASQLPLTDRLRELCEFVPTSEFRVDISSRQLRQRDAP